jgi:hypothetical protein
VSWVDVASQDSSLQSRFHQTHLLGYSPWALSRAAESVVTRTTRAMRESWNSTWEAEETRWTVRASHRFVMRIRELQLAYHARRWLARFPPAEPVRRVLCFSPIRLHQRVRYTKSCIRSIPMSTSAGDDTAANWVRHRLGWKISVDGRYCECLSFSGYPKRSACIDRTAPSECTISILPSTTNRSWNTTCIQVCHSPSLLLAFIQVLTRPPEITRCDRLCLYPSFPTLDPYGLRVQAAFVFRTIPRGQFRRRSRVR